MPQRHDFCAPRRSDGITPRHGFANSPFRSPTATSPRDINQHLLYCWWKLSRTYSWSQCLAFSARYSAGIYQWIKHFHQREHHIQHKREIHHHTSCRCSFSSECTMLGATLQASALSKNARAPKFHHTRRHKASKATSPFSSHTTDGVLFDQTSKSNLGELFNMEPNLRMVAAFYGGTKQLDFAPRLLLYSEPLDMHVLALS